MMQDEPMFDALCEQIEEQLKRQLTSEERAALHRVHEVDSRGPTGTAASWAILCDCQLSSRPGRSLY